MPNIQDLWEDKTIQKSKNNIKDLWSKDSNKETVSKISDLWKQDKQLKQEKDFITTPAEEWEGLLPEIGRKAKIIGGGLVKGGSLGYFDPIGKDNKNLSTGENILAGGADLVGSLAPFTAIEALTGPAPVGTAGFLAKAGKLGKLLSPSVIRAGKIGATYGALKKQDGDGEGLQLGQRAKSALTDAALFGGGQKVFEKLAPKISPLIEKGIAKAKPQISELWGKTAPKAKKPISELWEKVVDKTGFKSPIVTAKTPLQKSFRQASQKNLREVEAQMIEVTDFTNKIRQQVPKLEEREMMSFIREKTGSPVKLGDKFKNISPRRMEELKQMMPAVEKHFKDSFNYMRDHSKNFTLQEKKDYVSHFWDVKGKKQNDKAISYLFPTKHSGTKKRTIETLVEGIDKVGLKAKTLDIAEIMDLNSKMMLKATHNKAILEDFKSIAKESGQKVFAAAKDAPEDWVKVDHPIFNRMVNVGKSKEGADIIKDLPGKVHPEIADELELILGGRYNNNYVKGVEVLNGIMKKMQMTASLFHGGALTEAGASVNMKKTLQNLNPKKVYNSLKNREWDVYKDIPLTQQNIREGLMLKAPSDAHRGLIQDFLNNAANKANSINPTLGKAAKGLAKGNQLWDEALFDYGMNNYKLMAHETIKGEMKKKAAKSGNLLTDFQIGEEAAKFVNDSFGGQEMISLGLTPKVQQIAQLGFLSPDWFISTMRQAISPTGLGAVHSAATRAGTGARFWAKASLYSVLGYNSLNYMMTKFDKGEGVGMEGNDPGHKTHVYIGRNKDGSKKYLKPGKQFRELPELITKPLKKLGGKVSPLPQLVSKLYADKSVGGFPNWDTKYKEGWDWTKGAASTVGKSFLPFSVTSGLRQGGDWNPAALVMPVSKGMSDFSTRKLMKEALDSNNEVMLKNVFKAALDNKLDADKLLNSTLKSYRSRSKK